MLGIARKLAPHFTAALHTNPVGLLFSLLPARRKSQQPKNFPLLYSTGELAMESVRGGLAGISATTLPTPFLSKTYDMVDDPATDNVVSWSQNNNSFIVWSVPDFSRDLLPKHFKHSNFSSFVRQLNTYGFRKVDPDRWEFAHEGFLRGQKHLLKSINRRKPSNFQVQQQPADIQNSSASSCIEVGKFGMEEEVEMLKRDKNVLMQELVRLRHQQQTTDNQLHSVGQRLQAMEKRQQQMMSFLAKVMQSPGFVARLVHQQNDTNRKISSGNKKRRIPDQDENLSHRQSSIASPDGQITKYQPLMNAAAKAMLTQILNMSTSPRLESKFSDADGLLIDNPDIPSNVPDTGRSANRASRVTLSEVLPSSAAHTETQSSSSFSHEMLFPEAKTGMQDFVSAQGLHSQNFDVPDRAFDGADSTCLERGVAIPGFVDTPIPDASDEFLADDDVILPVDLQTLSGIHDAFWEQFLPESPLTVDTEEMNPGNLDQQTLGYQHMEHEPEWEKLNLNNLTEQMGLLASSSKSV